MEINRGLKEITKKRLNLLQSKWKITEEKKNELLQVMTGNDSDLHQYNFENNITKSWDTEYLSYYDKKINDELATAEENRLWPKPSTLLEETEKKEYLIKMFFELEKRHENYEEEKSKYTPEQLTVVNKIEQESGGQVKCIVDTNFLKAFGKVTGVDYRWAWVLWKWVIVWDAETLIREPLLRHEAIHCAQQRDMWFYKRLRLSLKDSKVKQFSWPEKWTASAVDYGTDNQATDLETYMNQFDPDYLPNRNPFDHEKYYNQEFLQSEYKRLRERELTEINEELELLKNKDNLTFEEQDRLKKLESDRQQFERMLSHLENDGESRVVLIEPDVLPSKADKSHKDYDPKAQVWTESITNLKKRTELEKNLYKNTQAKLLRKQKELENFSGNLEDMKLIEKWIQDYKILLKNIKWDRDKSRAKHKQDRKELLEERRNIESKQK